MQNKINFVHPVWPVIICATIPSFEIFLQKCIAYSSIRVSLLLKLFSSDMGAISDFFLINIHHMSMNVKLPLISALEIDDLEFNINSNGTIFLTQNTT